MMRRFQALLAGTFLLLAFSSNGFAIGQTSYVDTVARPGSFAVAQAKTAATIYVDSSDWPGVVRAAGDLQADIERVTGLKPRIANAADGLGPSVIIIGTVGRSPIIDRLIQAKKIDVTAIKGKWETFFLQVVPAPLPGVANALVIAGATSVRPSTGSTICPNRSASRPGTGGRTCRWCTKTRSS